MRGQRMRRQEMAGGVSLDLLTPPVGQWVDLDVTTINLEYRQILARRCLMALPSRYPGIEAFECPLERRDLSEGTAAIRIPHRAAQIGIQPSDFLWRGSHAAHVPQSEMPYQPLAIFEGLPEMAPGIDEQDRCRRVELGNLVKQDRRVDAEG